MTGHFCAKTRPATRAAGRLGSPERGAVADRRAVTEGLRPAWIYPPASPPVVGEGFHALPAWEDGLPRIAYNKWCAGCAREIAYVGRWTRGRRTVGDVGAVGHAGRLRLTRPGGRANAGRRGRRPLRWVRNERCGIRRDGCGSLTPHQWCAGCARGIAYVGLWTRGGRTVENAGAIGHAGHPRQRCPGGHATAVHRGRCTLHAAAKPALRHTSQRVRKTIPHGSAKTYPIAHPVGGGVPDALPLDDERRNCNAEMFPTHCRAHRPRCAVRRMTDGVGSTRHPTSAPARRGLTDNVGTPHPRYTNPSVTAQSAATAPLSGEPRSGQRSTAMAHLFTTMWIPWFSFCP